MKKITILVLVVLLLAVSAVPAFAHPEASDAGVATASAAVGGSPTAGHASGSEGQDNIVAGNPICLTHS